MNIQLSGGLLLQVAKAAMLLVQSQSVKKEFPLPPPPEITTVQRKHDGEPHYVPVHARTQPQASVEMPTTSETLNELKRRLGKELYRMELDLQGGGRIAGKPCDCLSSKHSLGLEGTAEELLSYEVNPVYGEITAWLRSHQSEFTPEEIAKHDPSHYQQLVPDIRTFRKRVMGTESPAALLSDTEKVVVKQKAMELLNKQLAPQEAI